MKLLRDESGRGLLEYGLILGLVSMVAIGALLAIGISSNTTFARAGSTLDSQTGTSIAPNR